MDVVVNNYLPGDPLLVDKIVYELKSQGIFDQFRKECFADVDTKPAYQNLRSRVEGSVTGFLKEQSWKPDMNKNQVREMLRKRITESGYLETGVERIVDQVVNPKINTIFLPKVEEIVYSYLGVQKPNKNEPKSEDDSEQSKEGAEVSASIATADLLPQDLEAVSPESVTQEKKPELVSESMELDDSKIDEDESPPFEPLDEPSGYLLPEENSVDSHLSGFSGLASHESNLSEAKHIHQVVDLVQQDSQMSRNSSDSRLSIVTSDENSKMDICEDSQSKSVKSVDLSNSNNKTEEKSKNDKHKSSSSGSGSASSLSEKNRSRSEKSDRDRKHSSRSDSKSHKSSSKDKDRSKDRKEPKTSSKDRDKDSSRSKDRNKSSSSNKHVSSSSGGAISTTSNTASSSNKDKSKKESGSSTSSSKDKDKDKDKDKSRSSSNSHRDRDRSDSKKSKSSSDNKHKRDDSSKHSSSSSSSHKKDKDKKREKPKDDHYSSKDKRNDRRSTDRDSSDGQGPRGGVTDTSNQSQQQQQQQQQQQKNGSHTSSSGGSAGDTSNKVGETTKAAEGDKVKLFKPKVASNFHEAMKLMRIRKQLALLERHNQLSLVTVDLLKKDHTKLEQETEEDRSEEKVKVQVSQDNWERMEEKLRKEMSGELGSDDDKEEECRYFDRAVSVEEQEFLEFVKEYSSRFERNYKLKIRYSLKRSLDSDLQRNNNNNTIKIGEKRRKKSNCIDIHTSDDFLLPPSPAESDQSFDKKDDVPSVPIRPKRTSINKVSSQRYSSDDLYKPRPAFTSSRRRGIRNTDN